MARKKEKPEKKSSPTKDFLARIRERYKLMSEADQENRRASLEDMKFVNVPKAQWDEGMRKERGNRPCYEFNKLRVTAKRIINDMRANRPSGKVRGVEDSDKKTAEIYEGLIRNIWNSSDGDTVVDQAAEYQVIGGMGAWRIRTKYVADDVFEQDIVIEPIQNPFCLFADPSCKDWLKKDAQDWILTDRISKKEYEKRWPNKETVDWEPSEFDDEDWEDDETVRIVEYWYKEPYTKEIWQLEDGKVIDSTSPEAALIPQQTIRQRRTVNCERIKMCIASGDAILEKADWAGSKFPFVMVYGEAMVVDGKQLWWGITRFAKDAQRSYNISRTAIAETIAMSPQAKWWATVEQAKGLTDQWAESHKKNFPFLLYNADPKTSGAPQRMGGADVPVALIQESQIASEEIKAVTGIYDASLGNKSNETSGRAITARQQQGEIATFNYMDNMAKGIKYSHEILIDLIPKVYDTEREMRILGSDGTEDYARINQVIPDPATGKPVKVNDLAHGRYDITVTVGPSWATKRQEAAQTYAELDKDGSLKAIAGDLMFRAMDLPYAEEIAERIKVMLPPQIQALINQKKDVPPEAQAVMAQANQAMQMVEMQMQQVQQAASEVHQEQMKVEKGKSEIQVAVANLEAKQAQFEANIAKQLAQLATRDAQVQVAEAQKEKTDTVETKASEFGEAISAIQQATAEFMQAAGAVLQTIQKQSLDQQLIASEIVGQSKQRVKAVKTERVNGNIVAIPEYEDQPTLVKRIEESLPPPPPPRPRVVEVRTKRVDGELVAVPVYDS